MAGVTLDTGALIAFERRDRRIWRLLADLNEKESGLTVPAVVLAQAWRGPRSVLVGRLAAVCAIEPLDGELARLAGELCGRAKTSDVVDAAVVAGASRRGDMILTSDPADLVHLAGFVSPRPRILDLTRLHLPDA